MRRGLADSLDYIVEQSRGQVDFDAPALQRLIDGLRAGDWYPASTFGIYYDLVPALTVGDRETAEALFGELASEHPLTESCRVLGLDDPALGHVSRYKRLLDTDTRQSFSFQPPAPELTRAFADRLQHAREVIRQVLPDLAAEQEAILREIILAVGDTDSDYTFDGGSSYMLWGALFLNAESHTSDVAMIDVLAHEASHSLLFGCCTEEPLVLNADDELFTSPLRRDPRPMDGIYHAAFVSARMHWAMSRLLESDFPDSAQLAEAESRRDASKQGFEAGYSVVAEHADLTPTGRSIMQKAREYMDSV
ncbi:HEXXH motif-containing protein [Methylohalomonas lacus]|uniref:HEXXH motif-containing protein n=1 Tax=Methylohalomonas lacus TaxID=398773 RepID=A0AAE3HNH9_9GAMM|nr:HEXXH motif-containing putative peptide modification protein [Methylohalomonas lacus]MCS3904394.1 HEXXH motif-containing protein [Methylohalomonas lacus]